MAGQKEEERLSTPRQRGCPSASSAILGVARGSADPGESRRRTLPQAPRRSARAAARGALPEPGTPILLAGRDAGIMRSGRDGVGLALLRTELAERAAAAGEPLLAGDARLTPIKPEWASY